MTPPAERAEGEPDMERAMTSHEEKWWAELKKLVRRMPKNVELHAGLGTLGIAPNGSRDRAFEEDPCKSCDTVNKYDWDSMSGLRLDGRDSTL